MNVSKKARHLDPLSRVRKRISIGKAASDVGHNAAQQRASLLKNNKSLAITLEETRSELSTYKNYFEESLEFMSKAKLAKSRMGQLSDAFKNFIKAFDENLALLVFDESKLQNIKPSSQSNKLNPVLEMVGEVSEDVSFNREVNCDDGSSLDWSNKVFEKAADKEKLDDNSKSMSKSPQKKIKIFAENNKYLGPTSQTGDAEGTARTYIPITSVAEVSKNVANLNALLNPVPPTLSTEKVTKIPRPQVLTVNLKRQNLKKEISNLQNKTQKQKLPEKVCEESGHNFSRRQTFVIKHDNVLKVTECIKILSDDEESEPLSEGASNLSQNRLVSRDDKRQTFVIKLRDVPKETEPATNLNTRDKELMTENRVNSDETRDVHDGILKNDRRKTFVKKPSLHRNDVLENQIPFPNRACISVNSDNVSGVIANLESSDQSENLKLPNLQCNGEHSETDHAAKKSKLISDENSKIIADTAGLTPGASSKEMLSVSNIKNKTEEVPENIKSKIDIVTVQTATEVTEQNADVVNEEIVTDDTLNTHGSFLRSSELDCEVMCIDDLVNFREVKPVLETTPIRRQITEKKKRKFVFDGKKRNTIVKKRSNSEIINFDTGENCSHKSVEVCQIDVDAISNNENDKKITDADAVNTVSEVVLNRDDLADISSHACAVKKKNKTSSRKFKDNQITSAKGNATKKSSKVQNKKKTCADIDMDDLIPLSKKVKKRNANKKKNKDSCFDDNAISKFVEVNKATKLNKVKRSEKELESDFPCEKTGENTFLVRAEIHPPPSSLNMAGVEKINMENAMLNLQHMQVTVVLDDVLKSKNVEHLNISDKSLLCGQTVHLKSPFSDNKSYFAIDPEESIEKLRCDPAHYTENYDLDADAVLATGSSDFQINQILDTENTRSRRRKEINYKEKALNRKMRRT